MTNVLGRVFVTLALGAAATILISTNGTAAHADIGCSVFPSTLDPVPVFAEPSTSSPQVGTLSRQGAESSCGAQFGSAYDLCGGGNSWVRLDAPRAFVPKACVVIGF